MKNLIIIIFMSFAITSLVVAQEMTWIPSDYATYGGCENQSDCDQNIVCYKLQYTPVTDGVLTSYTTGFFADCQDGETTLIENESCLMIDNSREVEACTQVNKILMNCSGNSGSGSACTVEVGVPIIVHQVCFQVSNGHHVTIVEDTKTDLTTSLDVTENNTYYGKTEFPSFQSYLVKNEEICDHPPGNISIQAHEFDDQVSVLNWTPAGETGGGDYVIERSIDGESFKRIETVQDRNFDIHSLHYEFFDKKAEFGYNHYRVTYVNKLGEKTISDIGSVYHFDGNFSANIYPNPVEDYMQLKVNTGEGNFQWTIIDETGKTITSGKEQGIYSVRLDLRNLISGAYFLNIKSGSQTLNQKFLKLN